MLYQWITLVGTLITLALAVVAWRARPKPGATPLVVLTLAMAVWNLAQFLATITPNVPLSIVWAQLHYVGLTLVPPALLAVVLEYAGREDLLNRRTVALLLVEPIVVNVLLWMGSPYGLFVHYVSAESPAATASPLRELGVTGVVPADPGPVFWLHAVYNWGLAFVSLLIVGWLAVRRRDIYREQLLSLSAVIIIPLLGSILDNVGVAPVRLTEACFVVSGIILTVAVTEFDLIDLVPVARATVLAELSSGILVIDSEGRITDLNPRARGMLDLEDREVIRLPAATALAHVPDLYERYESMHEGEETITVDTPAGTRHYRIRVSPLTDRRDRLLGRVFLIDDVTDQQQRQTKLQRQNEQLDRFASVVSHDLRNPLQVANGHVQLAHTTDDDSEHLEQIEQSHDRMKAIIDDVLTMARQGQTIEDTSPTDLHSVAGAAWESVDTHDVTLKNDLSGIVESDESRLRQVFENLFRNAVEHGSTSPPSQAPENAGDHGGDDVTVTVGLLGTNTDRVVNPPERGFYVEDDGDGIPADRRDDVFESGYTESETGTGLGLSIVESIVDAHGWSVRLAASDSGGARFEITGVDLHHTGEQPAETADETLTADRDD